jgi:hypothetical protein
MVRRSLACAVLACVVMLPAPAAADPVTIWDFAVFSGGGATFTSGSPETRLGTNVTVNGFVGSNEDMDMTSGATVIASGVYVGGFLDMGQDAEIGSSTLLAEVIVNGVNPDVGAPGAFEAQINGNIYGNLYVTGDVQLQDHADINMVGGLGGNVEYTGNFDTNGTPVVQGTTTNVASTQTFTNIGIPAPTTFTASTNPLDDRSCTGGGCSSLTLAPGTYSDLNIGSNKTLNLSSGDYFFQSIDVNSDLILNLDVSAGPINIFVVGVTNFGSNQTTKIKGPGSLVYVDPGTNPSLASQVYLETHNRFNVNSGTQWAGTVFASKFEVGADEVFIGTGITWYGAAYGLDSVDIHQNSTINYIRSYRADLASTAVPEPSTLALLGTGALALVRRARRRPRA